MLMFYVLPLIIFRFCLSRIFKEQYNWLPNPTARQSRLTTYVPFNMPWHPFPQRLGCRLCVRIIDGMRLVGLALCQGLDANKPYCAYADGHLADLRAVANARHSLDKCFLPKVYICRSVVRWRNDKKVIVCSKNVDA